MLSEAKLLNMTMRYRSENGKLARGVKKNFNPEQIAVLTARLAKARLTRAAKRVSRKRRQSELKSLIASAASIGMFIPVQDFE